MQTSLKTPAFGGRQRWELSSRNADDRAAPWKPEGEFRDERRWSAGWSSRETEGVKSRLGQPQALGSPESWLGDAARARQHRVLKGAGDE